MRLATTDDKARKSTYFGVNITFLGEMLTNWGRMVIFGGEVNTFTATPPLMLLRTGFPKSLLMLNKTTYNGLLTGFPKRLKHWSTSLSQTPCPALPHFPFLSY